MEIIPVGMFFGAVVGMLLAVFASGLAGLGVLQLTFEQGVSIVLCCAALGGLLGLVFLLILVINNSRGGSM